LYDFNYEAGTLSKEEREVGLLFWREEREVGDG